MAQNAFAEIFTADTMTRLFPSERSNEFFEALFGDASEGAYDITLGYRNVSEDRLVMELELHERPGCCLACNLTHGLPQVFSRHPIIDINGLVKEIDALLGDQITCGEWQLGQTEQRSQSMHVIPLTIALSR
ncbi:MAG: pancreas/duodenum homeobox protein 1 [Desulfopila sp.]